MPDSTRDLEAALRLALELAQASGDLERAMMWQDPPHVSYAAVMKRLQAQARSQGWSWKSVAFVPPDDV
jgi:hypothetical protein